MWLFPWNTNSDFFSQYEILGQDTNYSGKSIWTLFKAIKKSTREPFSIFRYDIKDQSNNSADQARQFLKRIKTLRHPSILKYIDSSESDKSICIVTESVVPLAHYLFATSDDWSQPRREFFIAYGLLNVAKGIGFMNTDCQLNHNNINIHSIFVNNSGIWKIGGLEYVCPIGELPPPLHEGLDEKYTPPERLDPTKVRHPGGPFAVDSWGMGCLVWESFNQPLAQSSSVKTVGKMPKSLSLHYNKLVQSSPKHRVSPNDFIRNCREAGIFFNTKSLETILFLEEIQLIKDNTEKSKFFTQLENELDSFPEDLCKNKILSDLINAFEYGGAGSSILNPIFKIGKMLDDKEYQTILVPCIIKLYACKDRATRAKLLQQLDSYINYLAPTVINDQIFPQIIQGFLDSNFTIREQTIKSMLPLAPKLSAINLNDELMKHLTRLMTRDEEGGIRANTTVCLGKIAKYLNSDVQHTVLLPTLVRVIRDPFPPTRHAAIASLLANESIFNVKDCAVKIMPSICHVCIDPDTNVRKLAFIAMRKLLSRLEGQDDKVSESSDATVQAASIPPLKTICNDSIEQKDEEETPANVKRKSVTNDLKSISIKKD